MKKITSRSLEDLLKVRKQSINPCLSVSYQKPLKIVKGRGVWLYDEDGQAYLDMVNNVSHVGHCHPKVTQAGIEQMQQLNTNSRYLHDNLAEYSLKLLKTFPEQLSVVFFCCTGSEANELALRLARAKTGGDQIITVDGAYHGNTQTLIDISPYKHNSKGGTGAPDYVQVVPVPDIYRGVVEESEQAGYDYAQYLDQAIKKIQNKSNKLSAFICESLLGCGGQMPLPEGYLTEAYKKVHQAGGVCIADEVQVGFGRCGTHMWAFEKQNVVPDIVTLGKPIGNGHPLAAVVTTREIADAFNNGMEYFNTFGANPVSCAIGLSVLEVIEEENLQANALEVGNYLLNELEKIKAHSPHIGDVRGTGFYIGVEFVNNKKDKLPAAEIVDQVVQIMRDKNILLSTDGPAHNVLKIKPPMVFSKENANQFLDSFKETLKEMGIWNQL
jgi:4-aminobutyrate aminotransferase-like enzyme